jgi:hypothetical protein
MSGTETLDADIDALTAVLDRQSPIDSLDALIAAVDRHPEKNIQFENIDLEKVAIGIDSSVFLKLATHKNSEDIIDYLGTKHVAPLILPGQAVQEYWNNQHTAILTLSAGIENKFEALKKETEKIDPNFGEYAAAMDDLLKRFSSEYGFIYDKKTIGSTQALLKMLKEKAFLSYVPRTRFHDMAENRKQTKTPPGFKDDGDGDFFVWVEFLYGLLKAKGDSKQFNHAVILTHDRKLDWSRAGIAHPILTAEMKKLVGVPFDVWNIEQLSYAISHNSSAASRELIPKADEIAK